MSDLQCPARVFLARHGEAEYESALLLDMGGSLTTRGRDQARQLGRRLAGEKIAVVYSSPRGRAVQTAELAAYELGVEVAIREGLHEFGPGDHRGAPAGQGLFDREMAAWRDGDVAQRIPGGESGTEIATRVLEVLSRLADQHRGESVLVVSHGGAMCATLACTVTGAQGCDIDNCASYLLEGDADGWRGGGWQPVSA